MGGGGFSFGGDDEDIQMGSGGGRSPRGFSSMFAGMPGGMPGSDMPRSRPSFRTASPDAAPSEITKPLKLSLEDLYSGTTKRLKVGRKLLSGGTEEKILEIEVQVSFCVIHHRPPYANAAYKPGWKAGTKIRFPHAGNELPTGEVQDVVFVVEEKPHPRFTRDGNNLIANVQLPLVDALTGATTPRTLELLDGRKLRLTPPSGIVKPGTETRTSGEGMLIRKGGTGKARGDLIVKWDVLFPNALTPAQKESLRKILT